MIEKGKSFLMLKISTPPEFSFYDEHQRKIKENGYVWFCRFGRGNLVTKSINKDGNLIFIKEAKANGGTKYILEFSEVTLNTPASGYPEYYDDVHLNRSIWFKVTSIKILENDFEDSFRLSSSGGTLDGVYRSMCNSFYITCSQNFEY